jgi:two-component system response regulator NreC
MNTIKVLLVDDHTILREGLRAVLENEPDLYVVGEAEDGLEAVKAASVLNPDVVLMDVAMPRLNGIEATHQIHHLNPCIKILILSMHDDEEYIRLALAAGAMGYLLKDSDTQELMSAIRAVHKGDSVLSPAITRLVVEDYLRWGDLQPKLTSDGLSRRERQVLQLIAEGHTNKQISEILCLSIKTIQTHRANMMTKLDLHDRSDLIKYAIRKKIIEI